MMKFKRVVAGHRGGPEVLQLVEEDLPEPPPGEMRVKVLTAGVLLADILWQTGKVPGSPKPPFTPGYDVVGVVDKLSEGVSTPEVGQTVAAMIQYGGYTEYVCVPAEKLVPVPDGLDPAEIVCLTVNYTTAYQIFKRVTKVTSGKRALIHGAAGGTGSAMLELGRLMDLEMYGTASEPKHDLVSGLGAIPIDYRNEDFVERIFSLTGDGVDVVVDPIGGSNPKRSFKTLRPGGFLVVTAFFSQIKEGISTMGTILGMLRIPIWNMLPNRKSASWFDVVSFNKKNPTYYAEDLKVLMDYLAEGKIKPVIADRMPLVEARKAQELLLDFKMQGKIVLVCSEP
ncbi:MAG: medium chain dehydrogenase/reductase family protein [Candidatus Bipolaricaulia bacterium]